MMKLKLVNELTEAKKSKKRKKKTQYTIFNTPADILKFVKKRQRGLPCFGGWLNPDAGNVEYNQSMFNNMMGATSDGGSSLGTSIGGGTSNGGLSAAGDAGAGGGMGESLNTNKSNIGKEEKLAREFIRQNKSMINDKLEEFIAYCFTACDERVFHYVLEMLKNSNIEIPKPEEISKIIINNGGFTNLGIVKHYINQKSELDNATNYLSKG